MALAGQSVYTLTANGVHYSIDYFRFCPTAS
jgi:hypothetical protein